MSWAEPSPSPWWRDYPCCCSWPLSASPQFSCCIPEWPRRRRPLTCRLTPYGPQKRTGSFRFWNLSTASSRVRCPHGLVVRSYLGCGSLVLPVHALGSRHRANIMITAILCIFCFMTGGTIGFTVAAVLASRRKADQQHAAMTAYERSPDTAAPN